VLPVPPLLVAAAAPEPLAPVVLPVSSAAAEHPRHATSATRASASTGVEPANEGRRMFQAYHETVLQQWQRNFLNSPGVG
jgi:hypothetical protein